MSTDKTDTSSQPEQPDMIAQVGAMLNKLSNLEWLSPSMERVIELETTSLTQSNNMREDERAIILASAILAVAAELRILNEHVGGLAAIVRAYDLVLADWTQAAEAKEAMDAAEADARDDRLAAQAAAVGM